jgi:hypothetical protein
MNSGTIETKDISKGHTRPLRILHATITALIVAREGFDNRLIGS